MSEKIELEKCFCGEAPEMRITYGGTSTYYGIYCKCGANNRYYNSAIASIGVGIGNFPPTDRKVSIRDWNLNHRKAVEAFGKETK